MAKSNSHQLRDTGQKAVYLLGRSEKDRKDPILYRKIYGGL